MAKKDSIVLGRSSYLKGMETGIVRVINEPFTYDAKVNGVEKKITATKIRVLYDAINEFVDISVQRRVEKTELNVGDTIDFIGFEKIVSVNAKNGYNGAAANGSVESSYKAEDFEIMKKAVQPKQEQAKTGDK